MLSIEKVFTQIFQSPTKQINLLSLNDYKVFINLVFDTAEYIVEHFLYFFQVLDRIE